MYENIVLWRFGVIQVIRVTLPLQGCRFALPSTILRVALMEVWTVGGPTGMSSLTWLSSSGFTANRQHNNALVKYFIFSVFNSFSIWLNFQYLMHRSGRLAGACSHCDSHSGRSRRCWCTCAGTADMLQHSAAAPLCWQRHLWHPWKRPL